MAREGLPQEVTLSWDLDDKEEPAVHRSRALSSSVP